MLRLMQLIEQFLLGKKDDPSLCEDIVLLNDRYLGIVDGATDKSGLRFAGKTSGRVAAEIVARTLASLPEGIALPEAAALLAAALKDEVTRLNGGVFPATPPSACLICYVPARRELWRIGDCGYRLNGREDLPTKFLDYINGFARKALLEELLLEGADPASFEAADPGRELILPILQRQHLFCNLDSDSPFAYGILDGSPTPARFLEVVAVPAGSELVLCSDGYLSPAATLAEAEAELARELAADPLQMGVSPSTKGLAAGQRSFDDRSYLRLLS
jgi:glycerophosphoryl diester phosphodiesterase